MSKTEISHVEQVRALAVGESHVRLERIAIEEASDDSIKESLARVRNSSNQIANRLRKKEGTEYRVESVSLLAPDRLSILCMAVTTRFAGDEDDGDDI